MAFGLKKRKKMEYPKFLLGDNTDFPEDIFVVHMDYPRFVINLANDEVEILEDVEDLDENEIAEEMEVTLKAVEAHMTKALKILKTKLSDYLFLIFILIYNN